MKIVAVSDTHKKHYGFEIPDGDVFVHCGDFMYFGQGDIYSFINWMIKLPHKHKVLVAGNHDYILEKHPDIIKIFPKEINYLEDGYVFIDGYKFYGSPWVRYCEGVGSFASPNLKNEWSRIPNDVDVLITHMPPFNYCDTGWKDQKFGCKDLLNKIEEVKPKISIFGHVHSSGGLSASNEYTSFYNVSQKVQEICL